MFSYEVYSRFRDERGLKDKHVADATGITRSTFSDWKTGRSEPKLPKIMKIANFLKINPALIAGAPVYTIEYDANRETIKNIHVDQPEPQNNMQSVMLTDTERALIKVYRKLNDVGQGYLLTQAGMMAKEENFKAKQEDIPFLDSKKENLA